ncbi:putative dual-specificity RNA methyltransferase RlmN [Deltaproteobacteria bacterium]|nr:putative dual-specificity RNA methyltransferase RlmN [Deltaproteobacteria bacterium]
MTPIPLLAHRPETLVAALAERGVLCSLREARQVLSRVISDGSADPTPRVSPRKALVGALHEHAEWARPEVVERVPDSEGKSLRYLFRLHDGELVEAVRIGLLKADCFTVCLSSQVGCAMACDFCATGRLGLTRNLSAGEIIGCFLTVRDEAPGRITGAVFMGQGEPFHNYEAVIQAAQVLCNPAGGRIATEAITISTVGLVPQIRRYTLERQPFRLIVSLSSAVPARRLQLLPVAGRTSMPELVSALRDYAAVSKGRLTLAWVLMRGVNTGDDEIAALREGMGDLPYQLNLIDVNDNRPDGYTRLSADELTDFLARLQVLGVPLIRRYSVGRDENSACGMLAAMRAAR